MNEARIRAGRLRALLTGAGRLGAKRGRKEGAQRGAKEGAQRALGAGRGLAQGNLMRASGSTSRIEVVNLATLWGGPTDDAALA